MNSTPRNIIRSLLPGPRKIYSVKLNTDGGEVVAWADGERHIVVGPTQVIEIILRWGPSREDAFDALVAIKALDSAAFHAWITLGELISGHKPTMAELRNTYEVLEQALDEFKKATDQE